MPPLVSVLMPFFDTDPRFMEEAIESVRAQTYPHWELLMIDDGSGEASSACARRYAAEDPGRIRYLEHPGHRNLGCSVARRLGMAHAGGTYVCLLDADDYWLPNKLADQVAIMEARPEVGLLVGKSRYWFSWTGHAGDATRDHVPAVGRVPTEPIAPPRYLEWFIDRKTPVPCPCSVMARREAVERAGGFDALPTMYEDQRFYARMSLTAIIQVVDVCWSWYRQHPASVTSIAEAAGRIPALHLDYLGWLADYLRERGVDDAGVWRAVRRQQWLSRLPSPATTPAFVFNGVRRTKKWILKLEEAVLPDAWRRRLWAP